MSKINILYLIDVFSGLAGAERNLHEIVKNINKEEFTPYVVALKEGDELATIEKLGIYAKSLNITKIYNLKGIKKLIALIRFIKDNKIQIIVSYHESSDFLSVLAGKLAGVKILISSRRDLGYKLRKRHILAYKLLNRYFTKIITVSDAVAKTIQIREKTSEDKTITIYNGVDFARTTPDNYKEKELTALGIKQNTIKIGVLATFRPVKGLEYFINAAKKLKLKKNNIQFLIIGKNSGHNSGYANELELLSGNAVAFFEFQRDIAKLINMLDIVVLPSLSEGFSNTLIEAMSASKPVIATNVGGNPEAIVNGETGILVPPADEMALEKAIIKLVDDKDLRIKMGNKGKEEAQTRFNLQKMIRTNEILYHHLLHTPGYKKSFKPKLRRIVKILIASILYYSGLLKLLSLLKKQSGTLLILAYHNIVQNSNNYLNLDITVDSFKKQLNIMKKYFKIIPLSEGVNILKKRTKQGNYLCITFDEGYKGIYKYLKPLLVEQRIPATIFLTAGVLEGNQLLWFDELIYLISITKEKALDLRAHGLNTYLLSNINESKSTCDAITSKLKSFKAKEKQLVMNEIRAQLRVSFLSQVQDVYLDQKNLQELLENGISIGSHTMNHPVLANISKEEFQSEIYLSKQILERKFKTGIDYFAYPNGQEADYNSEIIQVIQKAGYKAAFTLIKNKCIIPFQIGRLGIYENNIFKAPLFVFDLLAASSCIKKMKKN